jgi:hypothetical protein
MSWWRGLDLHHLRLPAWSDRVVFWKLSTYGLLYRVKLSDDCNKCGM